MKTTFIAHRGFSGKYRENTSEAFREAVKAGFGGIETDIRVTLDGCLVCCHNSEARFADDTILEVSDHTLEELQAKPLYNPFTSTDLRLCTFKEYLEICKEGGIIAVIELKGSFTEEKIREVFETADSILGLENCQLQSFHEENLEKAHAQFPMLTIVYTCDGNEPYIRTCLEKGFMIAANKWGLTQETVDAFHAKAIPVDGWTVNDLENLKRMREIGCDFVESDLFSSYAILDEENPA